MASGSFEFSTGNKYITGRIEWTSTSNGATANTSLVKATLSFKKSTSSTGSTTGNFSGNVTIDGTPTSLSKRITLSPNNAYLTIGTAQKTVTHNSDGTKTCGIFSSGGISGLSFNYSNKGQNVTLDKIDRYATVTGANNFNDEQNPYFTFNNSGNFPISAKLEAGGDNSLITRDNIPNTGNYTFTLTEEERNKLRAKCPNSNTLTVRYTIATVISGTTFYNYVDRTMSIVNATPTAPSLTYADTNAATIAITENNQRIIRNKSTLRATVGTGAAKKGASIAKYETTINAVTKAGNGALDFGTINLANNAELITTVTDSRGNTAQTKVTVIIDDWENPSAILTVYRINNFETSSLLKIDGNYSSLNGKNSITCEYCYKKASDTAYTSWATVADNTFVTLTLDNLYEWNIKARVKDKISGYVEYTATVGKGIPIIFFDTDKRSVGVNCFPTKNESCEINGYDVSDLIYVGSQELYPSFNTLAAGTTLILGAYDYRLIEGLFVGVTIPKGYTKGYRLTAQVQTANENTITVSLNNISTNAVGTWSRATFRNIASSKIFKQSELTLETVVGYYKQGVNLKVENSHAYEANVYAITLHAYLIRESTNILSPKNADIIPTEPA